MYWAINCAEVTPDPYPCERKFFYAEDAVSKMTWFKGDLIAAGSFNVRGTNGDTSVISKGIARRVSKTTGITQPDNGFAFRIYPNPLSNDRLLTIENEERADRISFVDIAGRTIFKSQLKADKKEQQLRLPALVPGLYLVELKNSKGDRAVQKLLLH